MALLLFLFLPVLCFPELFFTHSTLYRGDLTWIHYPLRVLAAQEWLAGRIPLWNPYVQSGFPLLAEGQVGVLYPLNVLFLLPIPAHLALTMLVALHLTLAATATYWLARWLDMGRPAATLAGLSFGFGGFLMAQVTNLNIMTGGAWLPVVFWLYARAERRRRLVDGMWAGAALAMQCLTAQPQVVFFTLMLLASYALYQSVRVVLGDDWRRFREGVAPWAWLIVVTVSGLALAAIQLLPTYELMQLSARSGGVDYQQMTELSLPPVQWITLLLPSVFGNNVAASFQGPVGNFEETHAYLGILPLVMVPFSWRWRPRRAVLFFWLAALAAGWLAVGGYTPLYQALYHVPGFNWFRVPARWLLVVHLALAVLAGFGFDAWLRQPAGRRLRWVLLAAWLSAAAGIGTLWYFRAAILEWANAVPERSDLVFALRTLAGRGLFEIPDGYADRLILGPLTPLALPSVALLSRLGSAVALLIAHAAGRLGKRALVGAGLGLVIFDLALSGGTAVNRITDADHWQQLSGAAWHVMAAQADGAGRLYSMVSGKERDIVAGLGQYLPSVYRLRAASGHASPLRLDRYDALLRQAHPLVMLAVTGSEFVINKGRLSGDAEAVLPMAYRDDEWYVYRNPSVAPRAHIVHQAQIVSGAEAALARLRQASFDPRQEVILEESEAGPLPAPAAALGDEEIAFISDKPDRVEMRARLSAPGYLVLLDTHYPGWQAWVGDRPVEVLHANLFARAVYLGPGLHTVRFVFRPFWFWFGLGVSGAATMLLLVITFLGRVRTGVPVAGSERYSSG